MFGKKKDKDAAADSPAEPTGKGKAAAKPTAASKAAAAKATAATATAKAPKKAKAPKAKGSSRKNSLAKDGPGFFAAHIEKMIMAVTLAGVAYLIYAGFSAPGFDTAAVPEKLESDSKDLLNQIRQDHWAEIAVEPERQVKHDFASQVAEARKPTDPSLYDNGVWDPKPDNVFEKRGDPTLYPPEQLVVKCVSGALAVEVPADSVDPYEAWDDAEPIRPKQRKSRNSRSGGMGGEGGGYGAMGGEGAGYGGDMGGYGGMAGGPGATPPKRYLKADYNRGVSVGGMAGAGGMMGGYGGGYGGEGGGMGGYGGMMAGPGGGVGVGTPAIRNGLNDKNKDRQPKIKVGSRGTIFNAITAVVPHKKMVDEYLLQFQDSGSFIPMRDLPHYLSFELQRVDVTADPTRAIADKEWTKISDASSQINLPKTERWAARPFVRGMERPLAPPVQEVIDRNAVAYALTMPIPPLLVQDYRSFSKHPKVNWVWDFNRTMVRRPKPAEVPEEETNMLPGSRPRGGAAGGMGGYGGAGGGMGGYGGMAGGYGGEGGGYGGGYGGDMSGAGMGGYGGAGYGGDMMGGGYGGDMMGGYGGGYGGEGGGYGGDMMGGYGGMGGGYGGGMGGTPGGMQPEFKMVRCYDFLTPRDVGKVFRYRIRLIMRDPNYPEVSTIPRPVPNTLKDDVWARVGPLSFKEDQAVKADANYQRTNRKTDWSEPSPPARVAIPSEVYLGQLEFDGPRSFTVDGRVVALTVKEPKGSVVATAMDPNTGAKFAVESDARRGTVLAEKADVELIVPSTRIVKLKKDQPVDARTTIVDLRGGKKLAGDSNDDPLSEIGEMLILKRDGGIEVSNEFDDMFMYRMYQFKDEHEMAEQMGAGAAAGAGGMGYGSGGYGGG